MKQILLLLIFVQGLVVFSQDGSIHFETIDIDAGLSHNTIYSIAQDERGFLWFGTQYGLNRFDGYQFKVFRHQPGNANSLSNNWIRHINFDSSGLLWVATEGGLNRFDPISETWTRFDPDPDDPHSLSSHAVAFTAEAPDGRIWIASYYSGVDIYDPKSKRFSNIGGDDDGPLSANLVRALWPAPDGSVWIATAGGLDHYQGPDTLVRYHEDAEPERRITHNEVRAVLGDEQGRVWVGTTSGINLIDSSGKVLRRFDDGPEGVWVNHIYRDPNGKIWFTTRANGLWVYQPQMERFQKYRFDPYNPSGIPSNDTLCVFGDLSGNNWVGTYLAGVAKFERVPRGFQLFRGHPQEGLGLSDSRVRSLYIDAQGIYWIGTQTVLTLYDPQNKRFYSFEKEVSGSPLSDPQVLSVVEDKDGRIWMGTYYGGVNIWDESEKKLQVKRYGEGVKGSLNHDAVSTVFRDSRDRIWVATRLGLNLYDPDTDRFTAFQPHPEFRRDLGPNEIRHIEEDGSGRFWLATFSSGVYRFDPQTRQFESFSHNPERSDSLVHNMVNLCYTDSRDRVWVGTLGGLDLFLPEGGGFRHYGENAGFPDLNILGIEEGADKELWIASYSGLFRFEPDTETLRIYSKSDGLQSNQFERGASFKARDGALLFGGIGGFNLFYPRKIRGNEYLPPVVLTQFRLFDEEQNIAALMNSGKPLQLRYDQNFFSFQFAALDFTQPKKNRYAYKLEGLDGQWIQAEDRRFVSYSDVQPGNYRFLVKGSNSDGLWNETGLALDVVIVPPIWQRSWFQGLGIILFFMLIGLGHQLRTRAVHGQNRRLERLVRARTADLERTQQKLFEAAHKAGMAEIASGFLHHIGNILNTVNVLTEDSLRVLRTSKIQGFLKANQILEQNKADLVRLFTEDKKGKLLPHYYLELGYSLREERETLLDNGRQLREKFILIQEVVRSQLRYAGEEMFTEHVDICGLLDEAMSFHRDRISDQNIEVLRRYREHPMGTLPKARLFHVFAGLIQNACEAMERNDRGKRPRIILELDRPAPHLVRVAVEDNGPGIGAVSVKDLFRHGFSTKKDAKGFGLHICANFIGEMGGDIKVDIGEDGGARFIVSFPLNPGDRKGLILSTDEKPDEKGGDP